MKSKSNKCFLSIDLEYFNTTSFYKSSSPIFDSSKSIEPNTIKILKLFQKKNVKATFFVVGRVAQENPKLIKEIFDQGHEIANHSFSHKALWNLTCLEAQKEILQTNEILQNITGKKVIGFRAPFASLDSRSSWLPSLLENEGFLYDSSIFPMKTFRHGLSNSPKQIYKISDNDLSQDSNHGVITEIPFSIYNTKLINIPCSGGLYARFIPYYILNYFLKECLKDHGHINFYFHPWEINNNLKNSEYKSYIDKFLTKYNSNKFLIKIEKVLCNYEFDSFENLLFK